MTLGSAPGAGEQGARRSVDDAKGSLVRELELDGRGEVSELVAGLDILIGLSVPDAFSVDDVAAMVDDAIVLALADLVEEPSEEAVLPGVLDERVVPAVARAVAGAR